MTNNIEDNKKAAAQFLKMIVAGQIDEAYEKFVDMKGKHHNAHFPAGFAALRDAMKASHVQFPKKQFSTHFMIGENNLVSAHSHVTLQPGNPGISVVHTFLFESGKIAEMWDVAMLLPEQSPNKDGIF